MNEWLAQPLGSLAALQKGRKVETSEHPREGFAPYLGASAISGVVEEYGDMRAGVMSAPGDVLMLWDGERSGLVGKAQAGVISSTVARLSPKIDVDGEYLYYALDSKFEWIQGRRTGTGVPHVPKDLARILSISYPKSKNEQRRIAEILSTLDEAIAQTEALIAKHQQIKVGLMHDLFIRGVTPDGHLRPTREQAPDLYKESPLGWIPKEWEAVRLDSLILGIDAGWSPDCDERTPAPGVWGVLKVSAVTSGVFLAHESKTLPQYLSARPELEVYQGDVITARANGVAELVGVTVEIGECPEGLMLSDKLLRLRPNTSHTIGSYIAATMKSSTTRNQLAAVMSGSSGQRNISQAQIRGLLVPQPSLVEQGKISACLASLERHQENEVALLSKLCQQKHGLMHDLLTGRVRVAGSAVMSVK